MRRVTVGARSSQVVEWLSVAETALSRVNAFSLLQNFQINALGPALVCKVMDHSSPEQDMYYVYLYYIVCTKAMHWPKLLTINDSLYCRNSPRF